MDLTALRTIRQLKKLNQTKVAIAADMSQEYLSLIERNKRNPSVQDVENICNVLDLELQIAVKT